MFKIKPLYEDVILPHKAHIGDAGFDVYATKSLFLELGSRETLGLGFSVEIPEGYMILIQEKSGQAKNKGLLTIGNVIDSGYRGEVHVIILNTGDFKIKIIKGQKIAQMILIPCYTGTDYEIVKTLSESNRGGDGLGSTGI